MAPTVKKAFFILMFVVAAVLIWALVPANERPVWRENIQLVFLGFTNPVAGETHAFFGFRCSKMSPYGWELLELSHQERGRWKRQPLPLHVPKLYYAAAAPKGFLMAASVPVAATNVPLRVVMQVRQNGSIAVEATRPPSGEWGKFYRKWQYRYRKWRYPDNSARWTPWDSSVPVRRLTNEFNFPTP